MALWLAAVLWLGGVLPPELVVDRIDAVVREHLESTSVPGVVVTVTEGHEVVLVRGWGLADVDSQRPMSGEDTLVRIASLSKTFTATAVAALEDEGVLDLDADVGRYLKVPSPGDGITLRHLLSHTSGIINYNVGRVRDTPIDPADFESFMVATLPPRLYAPGTLTDYTNHGNALAGLAVQHVTQRPFAEYVRARLLEPLGMDRTRYYLDAAATPELATSYGDDGRPWPYEYFGTVPASSVHTTAREMAAWLTLHAADGHHAGREVLSAQALARMRDPVSVVHPALAPYHYAFAFTTIEGHAARTHGGSVPAFLSKMAVFDAHGVGVFVAQNSFDDSVTNRVVAEVARLLPPPAPPAALVPADDGRPRDAERLVGDYRVIGKTETAAFIRAREAMVATPLRVRTDAEGYLLVDDKRYQRVDDLVFRRAKDGGGVVTVVFAADDTGRIRWVHRDRTSARRSAWHGARPVQIAAHALVLGLLLLGLLTHRLAKTEPREGLAIIFGLAVAGILLPHAYQLYVDRVQPVYLHPFRHGMPTLVSALRWMPAVAAALAIFTLMMHRGRGTLTRIAVGATLGWIALEVYWATPAAGLH